MSETKKVIEEDQIYWFMMMVIFKKVAMSAKDLSMCFGVGITRLGLLLLFSMSLLLPMVAAQPGFISIDCGSTSNYTDSSTGVVWTTDEGYISDTLGSNQLITSLETGAENARQITTARYFNPGRQKNCYALPVAFNNSYLIRATFLFGDLEASPPSGYSFNLSIDSTVVESLSIAPSGVNTVLEYEFFVASMGSEINFCVIPVVGNAFISSLELRPLAATMYRGLMFSSKYTKTLYRINCGAAPTDPTVRFPDDLYDRYWKSPGATYTIPSISTTTNLVIPTIVFDNPPIKIMQTAWSDVTFWFNLPFLQETTTIFYTTLYFVEIGSPKPTDRRSIDIFLNDAIWFKGYNITKTIDEVFYTEDPITLGTANFSFYQDPLSTLNPLVNGAEVHAIYDTVTTTTVSTDASALLDLQTNLNLLDWTGDPCLPVSWDWLNCSNTDPPRVTQLKLSYYQVAGTIPATIADLTALTDLWLDNNFISGTIPDLSGLVLLKTLHLQNNSLTGPIPASLAAIPNLAELFLENNLFTSPVPAVLLDKNGLYILADNFTGSTSGRRKKNKSSSRVTGAVVGAVVGGLVVLIVIGLFIIYLCIRMKKKAKIQLQPEITGTQTGVSKFSAHSSVPSNKTSVVAHGHMSHHVQTTRAFCKAEVLAATANFKKKIGEGGFGPVFYGRLETGEEVAVKVHAAESGQGSSEFSTEVSLLSRVHHRNLVSLVGFCGEDDQQILIYDYMQNGTLREHLYGKGLTKPLDWHSRLDIAVNAARGLEYLHYDCSPKIIHRDVKSNNILLNEKLLAKVADFGISKLAPDEENTGVSTVVRGTTGYLDPEYFSTNKLTQKSDVYAFGVVLLEIISGRAPNNNKLADPVQWNLVEYVRGMLRDGNLEGIVDESLLGTYNVESMWKLAELAMYSVEPHAVNRPDMRQVVRELMEAIDLEHVKDSAPTTATSDVHNDGGFTSILEDNTQTSYTSYPSTQSSFPQDSPGPRNNPATFTSLDSWKQPQAR